MLDSAWEPPDAAMTDLLASVARFASRPKAGRSLQELADELVYLRHACDLLELEFSETASAVAAGDEDELRGHVTPVDCIRHECGMSGHAALERVVVGRQMPRLPRSVQAVREGRIGFAHLALMARTAEAIPDPPCGAGFDESALLAGALESSVSRFSYLCHHARHAADAAAYAASEREAVERRRLELRPGEDGLLWIRGVLDPAGGAILRTALEPLARRDGPGDDRDRPHRMADALVEAMGHTLDTGAVPQRATQRTHLHVTATLETLLGRPGAPAADLELSTPISARVLERLACDSTVTRILLGPDSAVIDVGRSRRVVPPSTRRALDARDRGCCWPGCERPLSWTQAHHIVHWIRGGATDLDNLVLICARHHAKLHDGGWELLRVDGRIVVLPPVAGIIRAPDRPAA